MTARGQHLSDAWYLDHASGTLSLGERVFMESHVELNTHGAQKLADFESIGAQILETLDVGKESDQTLGFDVDDIFAHDLNNTVAPSTPGTHTNLNPIEEKSSYLPNALRNFVDDNNLSIQWRYLGPKLRKSLLWTAKDGTKLWMLKAEPGATIPSHSHRGYELTLVLKGSFQDQSYRFERGQVQEADDDTEHDIVINQDDECICLALTQAPLSFSNPLLRVFQLFIGI
jgi:putative transcriptional regulator